jgi:RNA polymerase sigma-70 factor (ECF subfamily)
MELSLQTLDFQKLKKQCLSGNDQAWEKLFGYFHKESTAIAQYQFRFNEATAEDITQDILIKLVKNLSKITNIRAWLQKSVRNRCIDHFRKKKEVLWENLPEIISKDKTCEMEQMEMLSMLKECISQLHERCQLILHLKFLEGYNQKEISHKIGLPYSQIPVNQSRCLQKLRKIIEKKYPHVLDFLETQQA